MNTFLVTLMLIFAVGVGLASCGPSKHFKPLTEEPTARASYLNPSITCDPTPEAWGTASRLERAQWTWNHCKASQ